MAVKTLKQGDVVSIPLGDGRVGLGQAIWALPGDELYLAVFEDIVPGDLEGVDLAEIVARSGIRLAAWTSSVLFEIDRWTRIANLPVREGISMPAYKVAIDRPGNIYVEDWTRKRLRPATSEEAARLPLRSSFSPAAVEGALKAHLGLEVWREAFDKMLPGGPTSQETFGDE